MDDGNVVQPDILFVSKAWSGILQGGRVIGVPDLCVEILSPGAARLDRVRSIASYDGPFRPAAFPGFEFRLNVVPLPDGF
jgi:hypothetical protein